MKSLTSIFLSILSFTAFAQTTLTVTNLNDSGPGSLRQQVFNSNSGDHIVFDAALLNNGSDTLYLHFPIIVDNGLRITGLIRGGDTLFISGHDSTQIFYMDFTNVPGQEVYLDSLVVVDAKKYAQDGSVTNQNGGAIFVSNLDTLVVANSLFRNCLVAGDGNGGAIYSMNSVLALLNSRFIGNHTDSIISSGNAGGRSGAVEVRFGELYIDGSEFIGNYCGGRGGALYLYYSNFQILNSQFVGNRTGVYNVGAGVLEGGAIRTYEAGSGIIEHCIFMKNKATSNGGALAFRNDSPGGLLPAVSIVDCLFKDNQSIDLGGGITGSYVDFEIRGSTFEGNICTSISPYRGGGALFLQGGYATITSSTIHNNMSFQSGGGILIHSYNLLISKSTFFNNKSVTGAADVDCLLNQTDSISISSSVIYSASLSVGITPSASSLGNNIFSDSPSFAIASDQTNVDSTMLALEPLVMNGGVTPTMLPGRTSVALNMGNPVDFADAQNGPIYGRRDVGAAERPVITFDTTSACFPVNWWGSTYTSAGTYSDTAYNANSIDSVGVLVLELQDTSVFELDGTLYASEQDTNTTYQWVDCANNYSPVSGATNQGFLPPSNGSYAVILTNQNCVDTSYCISYNRFSISERRSTQDWLKFYPNPSSGTIHYSFTGHAPVQLEVLDLSGRNVVTFELDGETTFTLPSLAKGTYLLRWTGSQGEVQVDRVCIVD